MTNDPIEQLSTLLDQVSRLHQRTGNITAAIRYCWPEWSVLVGRGAPFRAIDAANALGVSKASIDKAHHVIRREQRSRSIETHTPVPPTDDHNAGSNGTLGNAAGVDSRAIEERDAEGNLVRYEGRWKYTFIHATQSWRSEYL